MEYIPHILLSGVAFGATAFLVHYYARKDTPRLAYVSTFLGWFFSFILIAILPLDIHIVFALAFKHG